MKAKEIRELSTEEILNKIYEAREELMDLRFQQSTGELVNYSRLRHVRRLKARCLTILNERKREEELEGEA